MELGGLDIFDISSGQWRSEEVEIIGGGAGPEKRSVHALIGLSGDLEWEGKKVVGLMAHGEREGAPAELGHDGAGFVCIFCTACRDDLLMSMCDSSTATLGLC